MSFLLTHRGHLKEYLWHSTVTRTVMKSFLSTTNHMLCTTGSSRIMAEIPSEPSGSNTGKQSNTSNTNSNEEMHSSDTDNSSIQILNTCNTLSATPHVDITDKNTHNKNNEFQGAHGNLSKRAIKRMASRQRREKGSKTKKDPPVSKDLNCLDDNLLETEYYFQNGLRKVYPYYFTFTSYAKRRWLGRTIMDVFTAEFRNASTESYRKSIESGSITVNGKKIDTSYKFKDNDFLENVVHRHELSVTGDPIEIIDKTEDLLVINKASSIPVHPCGRYRHNSIIYILAKEYQFKNLRTLYRLDRLTSGLLIFGRTEQKTKEMMDAVRSRSVEKEYVCRVAGEFPVEPVVCEERLDVLSHLLGLFKVSPNGKECKTSFERLSFNGSTSIVKCRPHTGRTHQIRIHLQWLGFPIINDPMYNTETWGPNRGKQGDYGGKPEEQLIEELLRDHERASYLTNASPTRSSGNQTCESAAAVAEVKDAAAEICGNPDDVEEIPAKKAKLAGGTIEGISRSQLDTFDPAKLTVDENCDECKVGEQYRDCKPGEMVMYLHALRYKGPDWDYSTRLPDWAREDWKQE